MSNQSIPGQPPDQPAYLAGILEAAADQLASGHLQPGAVYETRIYHDLWCRLLADLGPCNCRPQIGRTVRVKK